MMKEQDFKLKFSEWEKTIPYNEEDTMNSFGIRAFKAGYESRDEEVKAYMQAIKDLQEQRKVSASIKVDLEIEVKRIKELLEKASDFILKQQPTTNIADKEQVKNYILYNKINEVIKNE